MFRKEAIKALSSAEDLDEAIRVTSTFSWLFVLTVVAGVCVVVTWGVFGTIATRVEGPSLISYADATVSEVVAIGSGRLKVLDIEPGQVVHAGQPIATLVNTNLTARLTEARRMHDEIERTLLVYQRQKAAELREFDSLIAFKRTSVEHQLIELLEQVEVSQQRLNRLESAERKDADSTRVDEARSQLRSARREMDVVRSELIEIDLRREERVNQWHQRLLDQESRLSQQAGTVAELENEYQSTVTVRAPVAGEIDEILAAPGAYLEPGVKIATIVGPPNPALEVLGFFPALDAKLIEPGMDVQVSPSSARREEYGTIVGHVTNVSNFPLSTAALTALLQDGDLARSFAENGPPLLVEVALAYDQDGSLQWSSTQIPPVPITAGTLATSSVVTRTQPPITLVLPTLRKWTGF